ncbi:MAG: thiamine-phosphate kinase [Elusimicrobia bacterium]|nr:thiamine-phosphate kinase [Elusimicrobiota bacterium]
MNLSHLGEFGLIERIREKNKKLSSYADVIVGIGDDCAVVKATSKENFLFSTDTLVENIHFSKKYFGFFDIGYKSLAVNLSDIAAMGGVPLYCLVTVGFPVTTSIKDIDNLYRGISSIASKFNVRIIGGDTVKSPSCVIISITVIGKTVNKKSILRSGANVDDMIFTTGTFGDSSAGLFLLQKGIPGWKELKQKHLQPYPKIKEGLLIAGSKLATSMIDSSDGFNKSVQLICKESDVGCEIYLDKIPVSSALRKFVDHYHLPLTDYTLFGGEEYELIFTVSSDKRKFFNKYFSYVGKITKNKNIRYVTSNNQDINFSKAGYDHFKK